VKLFFVLLGGLLFGFGLALSGMTRPEVVLSFLQMRDLGLLLVMGGAVAVTMAAYRLGPRALEHPLTGSFGKHDAVLGPRTILGAAIFGVGWGVSGLCPGSALASLGTGNYPILLGIAAMFAGAYVQGRLFD
jgi:uncharacterized membrane protein YedE/YeeE